MERYKYSQQNMCSPESCKRCYHKYNCAQYLNYLESASNINGAIGNASNTMINGNAPYINSVSALASPITPESSTKNDTSIEDLIKEIESIKVCLESLRTDFGNKLDYLVGIFKKHYSRKEQYEINNNVENDETQENSLAVYDSNMPIEKVLVEKKGLFGKSKWVEEDNSK